MSGTPSALNAPMTSSPPAQTSRSVALALFEVAQQAQQAVQALAALGVGGDQLGLFIPESVAGGGSAVASGLFNAADGSGKLGGTLRGLGVSDGETRFYIDEVESGRALVVVDSTLEPATLHEIIARYGGYDLESRGADLARPTDAGVPGGTGPLPADVTGQWEDVASRYEMLWQQHYGTGDATWDQMAPVYRDAWYMANQPDLRGRPWSEVEQTIRRDWESSHSTTWESVAGPIFDVWEDVAEEAATPAEGGRARIVERPLE
jgi:hypothetical protein